MKRFLSFLLVLFLVPLIAASAVGGTIFGPTKYIRTTGAPNI